jgi:hypothetical protein
MLGWNSRSGLAARNANFFWLVGFFAVVVYRALEAVQLVVAYLAVTLVCCIGFWAEGRIFRYARHDDLVVKLAFSIVMGLLFGGFRLVQHGWSQWVVVLAVALIGCTYHWWQISREP